MKIKEIIKKLEASKEFKEWIHINYSSSLVHVFRMFDEANKDDWQIGYYNKDDTITTFVLGKDGINIIPEAEIFKEPNSKVMKLSVEDVKVDMNEAMEKARKLQEEKYPKDKPIKEIVILQKLELGQVYNVTFVTQAFNTLNIKIDAGNGKIVSDEIMSLMDLRQK